MARPSAPPMARPAVTMIREGKHTFRVNDYVYLLTDNPDEPYLIGRILEFLPRAEGDAEGSARIGWFYRPRDVPGLSRKKREDPQLLIASMTSDINPVSSLRSHCYVVHDDHVANMDVLRQTPDWFHYNQLFDRCTHRLYDVVPRSAAQNLDPKVLDALREWDFILVEAGQSDAYTQERRRCPRCDQFIEVADDAITCPECQRTSHCACEGMDAAITKRARGWSYTCYDCTRQAFGAAAAGADASLATVASKDGTGTVSNDAAGGGGGSGGGEEDGESSGLRRTRRQIRANHVAPQAVDAASAAAASGAGAGGADGGRRGSIRSAQGAASSSVLPPASVGMMRAMGKHEIRHNRAVIETPEAAVVRAHLAQGQIWPFRYFGHFATLEDLKDSTNKGVPRARSRVGHAYQATLPPPASAAAVAALAAAAATAPTAAPAPAAPAAAAPPVGTTASPASTSPTTNGPTTGDANAAATAAVDTASAAQSPPVPGDAMAVDTAAMPSAPTPAPAAASSTADPHAATPPPPPPIATITITRTGRKKRSGSSRAEQGVAQSILRSTPDVDLSGIRGTAREVMFEHDRIDPAAMQVYMDDCVEACGRLIKDVGSNQVLHEAIRLLAQCDYVPDAALARVRALRAQDLLVKQDRTLWSDDDVAAFEAALVTFGHDLFWVRKTMAAKGHPKSRADLVDFFYRYKKTRRYVGVYEQFCVKYRPGKVLKGSSVAVGARAEKRAVAPPVSFSSSSESSDPGEDDSDDLPLARRLEGPPPAAPTAPAAPAPMTRTPSIKLTLGPAAGTITVSAAPTPTPPPSTAGGAVAAATGSSRAAASPAVTTAATTPSGRPRRRTATTASRPGSPGGGSAGGWPLAAPPSAAYRKVYDGECTQCWGPLYVPPRTRHIDGRSHTLCHACSRRWHRYGVLLTFPDAVRRQNREATREQLRLQKSKRKEMHASRDHHGHGTPSSGTAASTAASASAAHAATATTATAAAAGTTAGATAATAASGPSVTRERGEILTRIPGAHARQLLDELDLPSEPIEFPIVPFPQTGDCAVCEAALWPASAAAAASDAVAAVVMECTSCAMQVHANCYGYQMPHLAGMPVVTASTRASSSGAKGVKRETARNGHADGAAAASAASPSPSPSRSASPSPQSPRRRVTFTCSPCQNRADLTLSLDHVCVLCPNVADTQLLPLKKTVGSNWCHWVCALFTADLTLTAAPGAEPVEGIGRIPADRWTHVCGVCHNAGMGAAAGAAGAAPGLAGSADGAVSSAATATPSRRPSQAPPPRLRHAACVGCTVPGCAATVHVACAIVRPLAGWQLGFLPAATADGPPQLAIHCPAHRMTGIKAEPTTPTPAAAPPTSALAARAGALLPLLEAIPAYLAGGGRMSAKRTPGAQRAHSSCLSAQCTCHLSPADAKRFALAGRDGTPAAAAVPTTAATAAAALLPSAATYTTSSRAASKGLRRSAIKADPDAERAIDAPLAAALNGVSPATSGPAHATRGQAQSAAGTGAAAERTEPGEAAAVAAAAAALRDRSCSSCGNTQTPFWWDRATLLLLPGMTREALTRYGERHPSASARPADADAKPEAAPWCLCNKCYWQLRRESSL